MIKFGKACPWRMMTTTASQIALSKFLFTQKNQGLSGYMVQQLWLDNSDGTTLILCRGSQVKDETIAQERFFLDW